MNLLITGGTRRERSRLLLERLENQNGKRVYVTVPCTPPRTPAPGIRLIGPNDLKGALDAVENADDDTTLAVEGVDYWCMGPASPLPNPSNDPRVAAWNADMRRAGRERIRFRTKLRDRLEQHPRMRVMLTGTTMGETIRLLGAYTIGITPSDCERIDLDAATPARSAIA